MSELQSQILIDFLLIFRVSLAFLWGVLWATYLQFNRQGQFLAEERTWITVVVGVGVDLIIAYPADWWTVALVIGVSSAGIIVRSLWNEHKGAVNYGGYKVKWGLEDATAKTSDIVDALTAILAEEALPGPISARLSKVLSVAHQLREIIIAARRGDTIQKKA